MSDKYEEWGGSRWEFTKNRSKWHFDSRILPELGIDSFTQVGKFIGDFTDAVTEGCKRAKPVTWAGRNLKETEVYSASVERNDLEAVGADPEMELFDRGVVTDMPQFKAIAQSLGLKNYEIKFHNQRPGQMISQHIDNFTGYAERDNSFKETSIDTNPSKVRRYMIMLEDWKLGQFLSMGNLIIPNWNAGDCITWEWMDMPHGSANTGWERRPIIIITGDVTPESEAILHTHVSLNIFNV